MSVEKVKISKNEDGSDRYEYRWPDGAHVVMTGPVAASVQLVDGTVYDVTPEYIEVASAEHGAAVAFHIAKLHEASGKLGTIVHGDGYDGPALTIEGDETSHAIAGI